MKTSRLKVAHISDVHLIETHLPSESEGHAWNVRLVSLGRELNARARIQKLRRALVAADRSCADQIIISGDLTEVGTKEQFELLGEVLTQSKIEPARIVLVPGNHDAYTSADGWQNALSGPLAAYAGTSSRAPGMVVERGEVCFLPIDVSRFQSISLSSGALTSENATALEEKLSNPTLSNKTMVVVQHHPPFARPNRLWQWIDGLVGWSKLNELLVRFPRMQILHGHLHRVVDRAVGLGKSRVFGAPATVDDGDAPRVRLYELRGGMLESAGLFSG